MFTVFKKFLSITVIPFGSLMGRFGWWIIFGVLFIRHGKFIESTLSEFIREQIGGIYIFLGPVIYGPSPKEL